MKTILLLLALLAVPPAISGQDDLNDPLRMYRAAVILYQGKQAGAALRLARSWKPESVRRDSRRLIEDRDGRLAPGVALLLTEVARRDTGPGVAERLGIAEFLVTNLGRNSPTIGEFQERWYAFTTSVFIAGLDAEPARHVINRGLKVVGETSRLQLLSGMTHEISTYPPSTCPASDCRRSEDQRLRSLRLAAEAYRRASALDPHSPDAHLRLGRVLHLVATATARARNCAKRSGLATGRSCCIWSRCSAPTSTSRTATCGVRRMKPNTLSISDPSINPPGLRLPT